MARAAVLSGRNNARGERGLGRGRSSTRRAVTTVVVPTTVGTSHDIAVRFAEHFADCTAAELAQGAMVTKEAARLWLAAERCINLKDALQLVRSKFPGAKAWLAAEMGEFDSPQKMAKLLALLERGDE